MPALTLRLRLFVQPSGQFLQSKFRLDTSKPTGTVDRRRTGRREAFRGQSQTRVAPIEGGRARILMTTNHKGFLPEPPEKIIEGAWAPALGKRRWRGITTSTTTR